jgi:YesN/AraC family two-component response regulator
VSILNNASGDTIIEALHVMKTTFDRDARHLLVTIAVSPEFDHHSKFGDAYRQVSEMARQAKLVEATQIMTEPGSANTHFVFTPAQEHELYANLQAGNDTTCMQLIDRMLDSMYKADATITQFRQYAEGIVARLLKITEVYRADISPDLMRLSQAYGDCFTLEQAKQFFGLFISQSAAAIRMKKHDQDHIVQFVLKYIEERYDEDLSLDAIADRLNMSSAYLSIYMKEKTGTNFTDHVNGIRIQRAKELLDGTSLNIHDIGVRIGYQNVTSFIRMFKKLTGLTPGEYRKSGTRV